MIYTLIPARSGSKRVPHKNIKELGGVPLLQYSINAAKKVPALSKQIWVSTDSLYYAEIAQAGGAIPIMRHPDLASDRSTDLDVVRDFVDVLGLGTEDLIVYLRPTTPLRKSQVLELALYQFKDWQQARRPTPTSLRSVEEMSESAYKCFEEQDGTLRRVFDKQHADCAGNPNQEYPVTYKANGYIDIIKVEVVKAGGLWGEECQIFETPPVTEVDTSREWSMLELELKTRKPRGGKNVY